VTVRGRASAAVELTKVELFVGEALKDFQTFEPGRTNLEFALRYDVAAVQASPATMSVVACGGTASARARGIASIDVQVDRGSVASTTPAQLTRTGRVEEDRPGTETGPPWLGMAFGLAGLAGVVAATRFRGAREATVPSRAGAGATPGAARPPRARPAPPEPRPAASPPRPSPAPPGAVPAPGRAGGGTAAEAEAGAGAWARRMAGAARERQARAATDARPPAPAPARARARDGQAAAPPGGPGGPDAADGPAEADGPVGRGQAQVERPLPRLRRGRRNGNLRGGGGGGPARRG
jgi:hypothetical protein